MRSNTREQIDIPDFTSRRDRSLIESLIDHLVQGDKFGTHVRLCWWLSCNELSSLLDRDLGRIGRIVIQRGGVR